jgi:hypothetical protein
LISTYEFSTESKTEIARLRDEIKRGTRIISLSGLTSVSAKAFVLTEIKRETDKTFVIVTDSNKDAETWSCDLEFFQNSTQNSKFKIQNENSSPVTHQSSLLSLPSFDPTFTRMFRRTPKLWKNARLRYGI